MIEIVIAAAAGVAVGYMVGSPTTVETDKTVEHHIETPRVDVNGSVHGRGETSIDSVEADTIEMDVTGSTHERGDVRVNE